MKTTVIHHSADYDGIFCREIARKFLPDAALIGWDYGDPRLEFPKEGQVYVLDLSPDCFWESPLRAEFIGRLTWIDHYKSAIEKYDGKDWIYEPAGKDSFGVFYNKFCRCEHETRTLPPMPAIKGYRIDGVAACRLAWQWFIHGGHESESGALAATLAATLMAKPDYVERKVSEPLAVRLAGEYDIWDHRDDNADIAFQFGLDAQEALNWPHLLREDGSGDESVRGIIYDGRAAMRCYGKRDADVMRTRSFYVNFEGITFLVLNTPRCNSNTFAAKDLEMEPQHDGLMAFYWTGKDFSVSMYHASHRKELDLSQIAVKFGGGGHRGACGFRAKTLPFVTCS